MKWSSSVLKSKLGPRGRREGWARGNNWRVLTGRQWAVSGVNIWVRVWQHIGYIETCNANIEPTCWSTNTHALAWNKNKVLKCARTIHRHTDMRVLFFFFWTIEQKWTEIIHLRIDTHENQDHTRFKVDLKICFHALSLISTSPSHVWMSERDWEIDTTNRYNDEWTYIQATEKTNPRGGKAKSTHLYRHCSIWNREQNISNREILSIM